MTVQEDREQLFLELINRARLDPAAEAARYGVADLSAGTGKTISTAAKQVLAFNAQLLQSATAHNEDMISHNYFSHTGFDGSQLGTRISAANYSTSSYGYGENLSWRGTTGALNANAEVWNEHRDLFLSAGHRANILEAAFEEAGVSALTATNYQGYNALVTTHNFGVRYSAGVFVTGVHYTDSNNDDFYSIGESAAGRTVQLWQSDVLLATTTTANAGGYQILTSANGGAVEIVYSGGGLASEQGAGFSLGALNIKMDLTDNNTIETNVSATLTRNAQNLTLLSIDNVSGTGNALSNIIKGNKGNNVLDGADGDDTLLGGDGIDTLTGGHGNDILNGGNGTADVAVFEGTMASHTITLAGGVYTVYAADGSFDTVSGVESFQFSDGVRTLAQLQLGAAPSAHVVTASVVSAVQTEGNSGSVVYTFNVTLNSAAVSTQTVNFVAAGSGLKAANAEDFIGALSGTLTFLAGESAKTVEISVVGDALFEQDETFIFTLSGQSAGLSLAVSSVTATISNDDVPGPKIINGTALANNLVGTSGIDNIFGHDGNDTLRGVGGADLIDGGNGVDTADYSASTTLVSVNLLTNTNTGGDASGDSLVAIENVTGSRYADDITGNDISNTLSGGSGDDHLNGGLGDDQLYGGLGNDVLAGGAGADLMNGGSGIDTANYADSIEGVTVNLTLGTGLNGDAQGDRFYLVEAVLGSNLNDHLTGNSAANRLIGSDGDDSLFGAGGADTLQGGIGSDILDGGIGNDILDGGVGNDNVIGGMGNDMIEGGCGDDMLTGNLGRDTFRFSASDLGADTITDYDNRSDVISFASTLGMTFDQLVFSGQGTSSVTVSGYDGTSSIIVNSAVALTLDSSDFIFI
jgi:Ca2+-binding RTX toxin-like protein